LTGSNLGILLKKRKNNCIVAYVYYLMYILIFAKERKNDERSAFCRENSSFERD